MQKAILSLCFLALTTAPAYSQAQSFNKSAVIDALIGEAEGGGLRGMLAIAHAIRNRGTLKGVYGGQSRRVKERLYSARTFTLAVQAWEDSRLGYDITMGADHWQSAQDLEKRPAWINSCQFTIEIAGNYFYKCGK